MHLADLHGVGCGDYGIDEKPGQQAQPGVGATAKGVPDELLRFLFQAMHGIQQNNAAPGGIVAGAQKILQPLQHGIVSAHPVQIPVVLLAGFFQLPGHVEQGAVQHPGARQIDGYHQGTARHGARLRIAIDLRQRLESVSDFTLLPKGPYGYRLVLDLQGAAEHRAAPPPGDLVVAIDAGHGGRDPGASGHGFLEKHLVLGTARILARHISAEPGYRALLVRHRDRYISLAERTRIARDQDADLFISLHVDSFGRRSARGVSVYALSRDGATSELARLVAERENSVEGGGQGAEDDSQLADMLADFSMSDAQWTSALLGRSVLRRLGEVSLVHKKRVERANFMVLRGARTPALLIELGFVSNRTDARLLSRSDHQRKLAQAIFNGIEDYFQRGGGARRADAVVVQAGDTLSGLAQTYGVSAAALRAANNLRGDGIRVGQRLRIPDGRASSRRVRRGDTLSEIAEAHGVSLAALRSANDLRSDRIRVGQVLRIPPPGARPRTLRVRRGDTLSELAEAHGVSLAALRSANNLRGDRIHIGQQLRIPPPRDSE